MKEWKTKEWINSPWNVDDRLNDFLHFADKIELHDVTLRDGEQQFGLCMSKEEKVAIAKQLDKVGVHRIEAGMPAVSEEDAEAVKEIAHLGLNAEVYSFARCMKHDVDLAVECGCKGIITEIPLSEHMIQYAYKWSLEKAINQSIEVTKYAHEKGLRVVFFGIDVSRADPAWMIPAVKEIASKGHMDAFAVADTIGVLSPHGAYLMVKTLKKELGVPIEVHFHDDFGMGVATTLFGLAAGADVAHTSITGIGERAGNTPYEELAVALKIQYGIDLGLDLTKLIETSKLLQKLTGITVPKNRPVVGDTIFKFMSGVPVSWYRNAFPDHAEELTPYVPEFIGADPISIHLGKLSGRPSIEIILENAGKKLPDGDTLNKILEEVKTLAITEKREVTEEELFEIAAKYGC